MEEFMTRLSDFINEKKSKPGKDGNFMVFCMLGVVVLVMIILCLLLLWRKGTGSEGDSAEDMKVETFEVKQEEIMAEPEEDLQQEEMFSAAEAEKRKEQYLTTIQTMEGKIQELLTSMAAIQETLKSVKTEQSKEKEGLQSQINNITEDITKLVAKLEKTQNQLYDLTDVVNVMQTETIPQIQEQMADISEQMAKINVDITNLYDKIAALESADAEIKNKMQDLTAQIGNMQSQMQNFTTIQQCYRYDAATNTLYLFPES